MARVSDTGWICTSPNFRNRGVDDYSRTITFSTALDGSELDKFKNVLVESNDFPGNTEVNVRAINDFTYVFSTKWDSSD